MENKFVYLDYAASAPMSEPALAAEASYEHSDIAGVNPNSLHTLGRRASSALEKARRDIAACLGGNFRPSDVSFTSGGTESNNLALFGLPEGMRAKNCQRKTIIISSIEHDSELDMTGALRDRGFEVKLVYPTREGIITPEAVSACLDESVALVSVMSANNETGVVQPIDEIAQAAHGAGALMHTDAIQAFGRIPLSLREVDAVSIAAHKIGGPVGIGVLALRSRIPFRPQMFGGGQEQGRRPGTQGVRDAMAFAAAACDCTEHLDERRLLVSTRAQRLYDGLCVPGSHIVPTTEAMMGDQRLPGMVSVMVDGVDSETLILDLDQAGFEVSAGSACSSGSLDASHVLLAMGISRDLALGSLRISFDERIDPDDLQRFATVLRDIVRRRRH